MTNLFNNLIFPNFYSFTYFQQKIFFFSSISKNFSSYLTFDTKLNNKPILGFPSNQFYGNSDTDKLDILQDNKGRAGIYLWYNNISNKCYVGSSIDLSKRFSSYYSLPYLIRRNKSYICNALFKNGYSNFSLTILEYIDISNLSKDQIKTKILEREQYYINSLMPFYNILTKAGNSLGYRHSEESILRMSGPNNPMYGKIGESNPFFGKSHSSESLEKMRKPKSELHKLKLSIANKGQKGNTYKRHSQETLIKLSNAKKGEKHPMFGKVALNAKKVYIYSLDNILVKECSSIIEAAKWFNTYTIKINKYILSGEVFDNKYVIRDSII